MRWALIVSSISSLAAGIPADLLGGLVRRGEWSPLQGLVYARRVPEGEPRSMTLASLAAQLPEPLRADAFAEAVAAARQIPDARQRAGALTRLLPGLPPEPRAEALIQAMAAVRELSDRRRIASGNTGFYGGAIGERYEHTGFRTAALAEPGEVLADLNYPSSQELTELIAAACAENDDRFPAAAAAAVQLTSSPAPGQPAGAKKKKGTTRDPSPLADITARIRIADADERASVRRLPSPPPGDGTPAALWPRRWPPSDGRPARTTRPRGCPRWLLGCPTDLLLRTRRASPRRSGATTRGPGRCTAWRLICQKTCCAR